MRGRVFGLFSSPLDQIEALGQSYSHYLGLNDCVKWMQRAALRRTDLDRELEEGLVRFGHELVTELQRRQQDSWVKTALFKNAHHISPWLHHFGNLIDSRWGLDDTTCKNRDDHTGILIRRLRQWMCRSSDIGWKRWKMRAGRNGHVNKIHYNTESKSCIGLFSLDLKKKSEKGMKWWP